MSQFDIAVTAPLIVGLFLLMAKQMLDTHNKR